MGTWAPGNLKQSSMWSRIRVGISVTTKKRKMKKSPVMKMTICLSDPDEANLILTNMMMLQMIMTIQGMKKKD